MIGLDKKRLKKIATLLVGENRNRKYRDEFIIHCISALPDKIKLLDAGAGQLKWKETCRNLEYVSQDFCQYDGNGDKKGLQTGGAWNCDDESKKKIDIISDIVDIPVASASFDAILCSEVLEHLPRPELAIKEFSRIIKPSGILILTAPFCSITHFAPYHYCTGFNRYWYEQILNEYGFHIEVIKSNGNFFSYLQQEILRLPNIYKKYDKKYDYLALIFAGLLAMRLKKKTNQTDCSDELLNFGYCVKAIKNSK